MARGLIGFALVGGWLAVAVGLYFYSLPGTDVEPQQTGFAESPALADAPTDGPTDVPIARTNETLPSTPVPAAGPAEVPSASGNADQTLVPLEKLLRLPRAPGFPAFDPEANQHGDPLFEPQDSISLVPRLRVEGAMKREVAEVDRDQKRDQIDVGASVRVGESTRIRGGVRIERDPNLDDEKEAETAPMIGVEKRF
jgi:hypothetical protein